MEHLHYAYPKIEFVAIILEHSAASKTTPNQND